MLGDIINLFYPALCQACGGKMPKWDRHLCENCLKKIEMRQPPFCIKCGKRLSVESSTITICKDCKISAPYFDRAGSACYYDGILKELVYNFKYKKITSLGEEFAKIIINFMKINNLGNLAEIIAPIPMHPKRLFKREVNHADILAKNIAKKLNIHYSGKLLKKIKETAVQTGLGRQKRIKNILGSFSIQNSSIAENKNILLVDDLFTTGSTVNECAKLLRKAGARYIEVIALARGDKIN